MGGGITLSAKLKLLLRRVGLEPLARRVADNRKVAAIAGLSSYSYRRNNRDDAHLSLLMSYLLTEDSDCIDIGANHGKMLGQMVALAPHGRHLAYEPIPELADQLRRRFPDATVESIALSDSKGTAKFSCVVGDEAYSGLSDRHFAGSDNLTHFDVPTAPLDEVIPQDYAPSFIKIDVEGAEYLVLAGARETLKRSKPTIWFEHGADSSKYFQTTSTQIWDLLDELDYRIFDSDGQGPISRAAFGQDKRMWSFVAH
jgi:FkbM family methyltransferase